MICMRNLRFSSRQGAKVRRQGPPGSARAHPVYSHETPLDPWYCSQTKPHELNKNYWLQKFLILKFLPVHCPSFLKFLIPVVACDNRHTVCPCTFLKKTKFLCIRPSLLANTDTFGTSTCCPSYSQRVKYRGQRKPGTTCMSPFYRGVR